MEEEFEFEQKPEMETFKIVDKRFDINWDKIQTIDDIKSLLKGLQLNVYLYSNKTPDHLNELFEKDLLIERKL